MFIHVWCMCWKMFLHLDLHLLCVCIDKYHVVLRGSNCFSWFVGYAWIKGEQMCSVVCIFLGGVKFFWRCLDMYALRESSLIFIQMCCLMLPHLGHHPVCLILNSDFILKLCTISLQDMSNIVLAKICQRGRLLGFWNWLHFAKTRFSQM